MFAAARTILSYCAVGGEVDPAAIDAAAFRLGKAVAYPLCLAEGHMEAALPAAADALAPGRYGIPAPIPGRCRLLVPKDVDLVLVPCAAFDASCRRVGMGADITTAIWPAAGLSLALAYEAQRVPQAAAQEHDVLLVLWPVKTACIGSCERRGCGRGVLGTLNRFGWKKFCTNAFVQNFFAFLGKNRKNGLLCEEFQYRIKQ